MKQFVAGFLTAMIAGFVVILVSGLEPGLWDARGAGVTASEDFLCPAPEHHDGDAIRCGSKGKSMRLYAIDAPEMPGACRQGRQCTPGDPIAARDHLTSLTKGRSVSCRQLDTDRYGRRIVQCFAGEIDISCAMVRDGYAVERYGRLRC